MTVIELTEEDAAKFVKFMEYYDMFNLLLRSNVFEQKRATIALNFDHNGILKSIQRADFLFTDKFDTK